MSEYIKIKKKQEKELNNFKGIFFAFNAEQFKKGMIKLGIKELELEKICKLGHGGGYILKEQSNVFIKMNTRHSKEIKEKMKDPIFSYEAFLYELKNHEFCITHDLTAALDALEVSNEDLKNNKKMADSLKKAIFEINKEA